MVEDATLLQLVGQEIFDTIPKGTPLTEYLAWAQQKRGGPPLYHLASAMAVACCELALRGYVLSTGEPMSIWFALVGASASGKSSAIRMADDFIHDVWTDALTSPTNDPWVQASGSVAGLLAAIQEHYVPSRGTTVCMLYEHEFSSMFASREAIPEFLCNLADGATIQRNLRELQKGNAKGGNTNASRSDRVYLPATSGLFATTEAALSAVFTEAMRHGGLYSRVWWIRPKVDPTQLRRRRHTFDDERASAVTSWLGWLAGLSLQEGKVITFSPEADTYLDDDLFVGMAKDYNEDDDMAPTRLRAVEKAQVVAAIFATMRGRIEVQLEDVQLASAFMRLLLGHSLLMQHLGSPDIVRTIERARKFIANAGEEGLTRSDLYRKIKRDQHTIDSIVSTLEDQRAIMEDRSSPITRYLSMDTLRAQEIARVRASRVYEEGAMGQVFDLRRPTKTR